MTTTSKIRFEQLPEDYEALCRVLLPRPIHDDVVYSNVVEIADVMAVHQDDFTDDQNDYFELLCTLIEEYDHSNPTPGSEVSGIDLLKHLLEEQGLTYADLSRILGASRNLGSMILRGERQLTVKHIQALAKHFCVSADLFIKGPSGSGTKR